MIWMWFELSDWNSTIHTLESMNLRYAAILILALRMRSYNIRVHPHIFEYGSLVRMT
jgi:hypothetical protein